MPDNRIVTAPSIIEFKQLLKGNDIGCLTAVYDTQRTGKVYFENIRHEDYAYWLTILKTGLIAKNTGTVEARYRVKTDSVSGNKIKAALWTWNIYRRYLHFSFFKSARCFLFYMFKAFKKYLK
jgi:hypothetical protein